MGTEKGMFKDPDKFTKAHQQMSLWFTDQDNAYNFVRYFCLEEPEGLEVEIEVPVMTEKKFLYGYADVVIKLPHTNILVELKSSISDYGATLRQLKTYQQFIPNVSKTVLVIQGYKGPTGEDYGDLHQFFGSQGIAVTPLSWVEGTVRERDGEGTLHQIVPDGFHNASLAIFHETGDTSGIDWYVYHEFTRPPIKAVDFLTGRQYLSEAKMQEFRNLFPNISHFVDPPIKCQVEVRSEVNDGSYDQYVKAVRFGTHIIHL